MLDQNTTTVLTTFLSVGGTLCGVFLGITLNKWQDNTKRMRILTEEFYELTLKVYRYSRDLFGDEKFTADLYETIIPYILRMTALANLYLRPIKAQLADFTDSLDTLDRAHKEYFFVISSSEDNPVDKQAEVIKKLKQAVDIYDKKYKNLKDGLEKLVK